MFTLTKKQLETYRFIRDRIHKTGRAPTYAQIAKQAGMVGRTGAYGRVARIATRGYLVQTSRGIRLSSSGPQRCFKVDYENFSVAGWPVLVRL